MASKSWKIRNSVYSLINLAPGLYLVGRYEGRIGGWDVVNEALDEDGSMRQSPWHRIIGDDFW